MSKSKSCLLIVFALISVAGWAQQPQVSVRVQPETVYLERTSAGQLLNFDFVLTNTSAQPLKLISIEVSALDHSGKVQARKLINSDGERASIDVIGAHELKPNEPLLVLNPFDRFDDVLELSSLEYEFTYANDQDSFTAKATVKPLPYKGGALLLPLHGRYLVWDGHDFYSHHRRFDYVSPTAQHFGFRSNVLRYAYDFFSIDEQGETHKGDPAKNESWYAFEKPIYAVADGEVVAAVDTRADKRKLDIQLLKTDRMAMFGNYVILKHEDGAYSLYGHIRQGSAKCKTGDHVTAGQQLASIGAAGGAAVPHLHFEMQTSPNADGEGLPSSFRGFKRIIGSRSVKVSQGNIETGDIVESDRR